MGFGDITGTRTYLTYVRLEERAALDYDEENPGFLRQYIGAGESKMMPWSSAIRKYRTKTVICRTHGMTGTLIIVAGFGGTGHSDLTGTYYQGRVGQGSLELATFTEHLGYIRPGFRASAVGSISLTMRFQT